MHLKQELLLKSYFINMDEVRCVSFGAFVRLREVVRLYLQ